MKPVNKLLERQASEGYLQEWKDLLAKKKAEIREGVSTESWLVFRHSDQWFALSVHCVHRVAEEHKVHSIPHRSGRVFRGMANISGDLVLCASLSGLFFHEEKPAPEGLIPGRCLRRMILMEEGRDAWAFSVDEVAGVQRFSDVVAEPEAESEPLAAFVTGLVDWEGRQVFLLEGKLLFAALTRSIWDDVR